VLALVVLLVVLVVLLLVLVLAQELVLEEGVGQRPKLELPQTDHCGMPSAGAEEGAGKAPGHATTALQR
jgi:hypothetical protein